MKKLAARPELGLLAAQPTARKFVMGYLGNTGLGLPAEMEDGVFTSVIDAIVKGMMAAWANGYMERDKESRS